MSFQSLTGKTHFKVSLTWFYRIIFEKNKNNLTLYPIETPFNAFQIRVFSVCLWKYY